MLTIRRQQLEKFEEELQWAFERKMIVHLRTYLKACVSSLDDGQLARHVRAALGVALHYGLRSEQDRCRFLNLATLHGVDFAETPEHRWMHEMLVDPAVPDPSQRLARLCAEVIEREQIAERNARVREEFLGAR